MAQASAAQAQPAARRGAKFAAHAAPAVNALLTQRWSQARYRTEDIAGRLIFDTGRLPPMAAARRYAGHGDATRLSLAGQPAAHQRAHPASVPSGCQPATALSANRGRL